MKLQGISVDEMAIAQGLYDMMTDDQHNLLAFGMLDNKLMDVLENQLKDWYDQLFNKTFCCMPEQWDKEVSEVIGDTPDSTPAVKSRKTFVSTVSVEVAKSLYGVASANGAMVV